MICRSEPSRHIERIVFLPVFAAQVLRGPARE
jgi:hypothetical protein